MCSPSSGGVAAISIVHAGPGNRAAAQPLAASSKTFLAPVTVTPMTVTSVPSAGMPPIVSVLVTVEPGEAKPKE